MHMAYSVQIYEFNTSKDVDAIVKQLQNVKKRQKKSDRCQIIKVQGDEDIVTASIKVDTNPDLLYFDITIQPDNNYLIVQGSGIGRNRVNKFLAKEIEDESRSHVVTEQILSVEQSIRLFKNIAKEHNSNFITILKTQFTPKTGFAYAKETYEEIAYKCVGNRCASKHRDFEKLCTNGKRMHMSMKVIQCAGLTEGKGKPLKLDISHKCSFRLYTNRSQENWNEFCFKIVNFL